MIPILTIAMDDGVRQSLMERYFDISFNSVRIAKFAYEQLHETHQLID